MRILVAFYTLAVLGRALCGNVRNASASELLDLSKPDSFPCSSFKLSFDDIPVTVMVLWVEEIHITILSDGKETVVNSDTGGFPWVAFHVNARQKPDLVIVPANEGMVTLYKKDEGVWRKCQHIGEADAFKVPVERKQDFTLDIAKRLEDYRFQILGANVQDLSIYSYFPRHGYYAMEVKYGNYHVWASSGDDEYCTYAEVYGSDSCMLAISTEGGKKFSIRHFENIGFGWMATPKKDIVIDKWNGPNGVRMMGSMDVHDEYPEDHSFKKALWLILLEAFLDISWKVVVGVICYRRFRKSSLLLNHSTAGMDGIDAQGVNVAEASLGVTRDEWPE